MPNSKFQNHRQDIAFIHLVAFEWSYFLNLFGEIIISYRYPKDKHKSIAEIQERPQQNGRKQIEQPYCAHTILYSVE